MESNGKRTRVIGSLEQKEKAAHLMVEAEMPVSKIAEEVGIAQATLYLWRQDPEFQHVMEIHRRAIRRSICHSGIGALENRVKALNDRWNKLKRVMQCRAEHPDMLDVPGGDTGLVLKRRNGECVLDAVMLNEMRALEEQAARELGQWEDKHRHEVSGPDGSEIKVKYDLAKLTKEDWLAIRAIRERTRCAGAERN